MSVTNTVFQTLFLIIFVFMISVVMEKVDSIKTDPVCEHARMALDTVNAQREAKK